LVHVLDHESSVGMQQQPYAAYVFEPCPVVAWFGPDGPREHLLKKQWLVRRFLVTLSLYLSYHHNASCTCLLFIIFICVSFVSCRRHYEDNFLPSMLGKDLPVDLAHIICESDFRFCQKHCCFKISELPKAAGGEKTTTKAGARTQNMDSRKNRPAEMALLAQTELHVKPSNIPERETTYIRDVMIYFNAARRDGIHLLFLNWYGGTGGGQFGRKMIPQHGFGCFVADRVGLEIIREVLSNDLTKDAKPGVKHKRPPEHIDVVCFQSFQTNPNDAVVFLYPSLGLNTYYFSYNYVWNSCVWPAQPFRM
jgi:hypothetical protein